MRREFWQKPTLHYEEEKGEHRAVTWLELFFDLYFVVVIAALAHNFAGNLNLQGFLEFVITFIPVWWVWIGDTFFTERFETDGFERRFYTFLLMIPLAGMAYFSHHVLTDNFMGYVLCYAFARIIITSRWASATYHVKEFRKAGTIFLSSFSFSIIATIVAAFLPQPYNWILFGVSLFIELVAPTFAAKEFDKLPNFSTSKLPERFGLFTIIVLGEAIVGTVNGLSEHHHMNTNLAFIGVGGIGLAFCLWWIYFDYIARRSADQSVYWKPWVWGYLHMPLVMAFILIGACLGPLINGNEADLVMAKKFLPYFLGAALLLMGLIEMVLARDDKEWTHPVVSPAMKIITGVLSVFLGILSFKISGGTLLLLLLGLCFVNMFYGAYLWFTEELPGPEEELNEEIEIE